MSSSKSLSGNSSDQPNPLTMYLNEISKYPILGREEEVALAKRIQAGDEEALKTLVRSNLRFVVKVAKQFHSSGLSFSDLVNEGNIGLLEAARRFDGDKGVKFITYAVWWIRQAIMHALAEKGSIVRLPIKQANLSYRISRLFRKLTQELGREPTVEDLAKELQLEPSRIEDLLRASRVAVPLVPHANEDEPEDHVSVLEGTDSGLVFQAVEQQAIIEDIDALLSTLLPREKEIIELRFGLSGNEPHSLAEIGKKFNLTRERIRQIESSAKAKLHRLALSKNLQDYLN